MGYPVMMFATLVVALTLPAQLDPSARGRAPIDADYEAQPGDSCLLGSYSLKEESEGKRPRILPADCYSSLEKAREACAAIGDKGRVSAVPEAYRPKALTPVTVKECRTVALERAGKADTFDLVKVEVMRGEFEGREFWSFAWHAIRFKGD